MSEGFQSAFGLNVIVCKRDDTLRLQTDEERTTSKRLLKRICQFAHRQPQIQIRAHSNTQTTVIDRYKSIDYIENVPHIYNRFFYYRNNEILRINLDQCCLRNVNLLLIIRKVLISLFIKCSDGSA